MKHLRIFFLGVLLSIAFTSCSNDKKTPGVPADGINPDVMSNPASASADANTKQGVPVFKFDNETHDFGKIMPGEKVSYAFTFTNVGTADLLINSASGSCGCTVPEWSKDPVPPGKSGIIKVTFDSNGKQGHQNKSVTILSNTIPSSKVITITATIESPEEK